MNIIITMAGDGRRFNEAGYRLPKPAIEVHKKTLFHWAISSLRNFYSYNFIFIARVDQVSKEFIDDECYLLGLSKYSTVFLSGITKGQAETALRAEKVIKESSLPILIYNIDTHVRPEALRPEMIRGDGWVPCFKAEGSHWSFLKKDADNRVTEVVEKQPISNLATIGLYYFSSFDLFKTSYLKHNFHGQNEHFVAPLYQYLLNNERLSVYTDVIDSTKVIPMGTPSELDNLSKSEPLI